MRLLATLIGMLAVATTAHAFPLQYPATVSVRPWVPTPQQHVLVTVADSFTGFVQPGPDFEVVSAAVSGNVITVSARFAETGAVVVATRTVDLGPLPAGRYTVNYMSNATANPGLHRANVVFSVADGGLTTVVEYYNAARDHYFVTADTAEMALLDTGVLSGWTRTGETFKVMFGETMQSGAKPVCRFYGLPAAGLDSHFFAASFTECVTVLDRWPAQWLLETTDAFAVVTEAPVSTCPKDAQPLYRLYNNRSDVNHRYTTSAATRDAMVAKGWVPEGSSLTSTVRDGIAMCVPL